MKISDELKRAFESMINDEVEKRLMGLTPQVVIDGIPVDHDAVKIENDLIVITINTDTKTPSTPAAASFSEWGLF